MGLDLWFLSFNLSSYACNFFFYILALKVSPLHDLMTTWDDLLYCPPRSRVSSNNNILNFVFFWAKVPRSYVLFRFVPLFNNLWAFFPSLFLCHNVLTIVTAAATACCIVWTPVNYSIDFFALFVSFVDWFWWAKS